jgi:hypothetical protein
MIYYKNSLVFIIFFLMANERNKRLIQRNKRRIKRDKTELILIKTNKQV